MASASSSRGTSPGESSVTFPLAKLHWSRRKRRSKPLDAWICISTALRWVRADLDDPNPGKDLTSFRGQYCLSLNRLKESSSWEDVEKAVVPFVNKHGPGSSVHGELTYPHAWSAKRPIVKLEVIFDTANERNAIMEQVRIRVSPWQVLYRRMRETMGGGKLLDKVLKDLFVSVEKCTGTAEDHAREKSFLFVDAMEEGAKGVNVLTGFLQASGTIVKKSLENSAPVASQVTQNVNECVKGVTIVSSVVQILVIATKLVELYMEMKHGNEEWLRIYARVEDLGKVVVERIISISDLDGNVDEILVMNIVAEESSVRCP